jgi:hypothetical protein
VTGTAVPSGLAVDMLEVEVLRPVESADMMVLSSVAVEVARASAFKSDHPARASRDAC